MSFFRRKSEKQKSSDSSKTQGLSRSASLKSENSPSSVLPSPKLWRNNNDGDLVTSSRNGSIGGQRPHTLILSSEDLRQKPAPPPDSLESPVRTTSRLSKTLQEIIHDKDGLSCFIEFMKSEKAEHLIQFWCDAESFQAATVMRLRSHALQSVSKSAILKRRSKSKSDSVSEDIDSTRGRHRTSSENLSVKSSNCDYHEAWVTKEGSLSHKHDVCSETFRSGIAPSASGESNLNLHSSSSSPLTNPPILTQDVKSESSITTNSAIFNLHSTANSATSIPLTVQYKNDANSEILGEKTDLESSKETGYTHCDRNTITDVNQETSTMLKEHSSHSTSQDVFGTNDPNLPGETSDIITKSMSTLKTLDDSDVKEEVTEPKQHGITESEDLATKLRKSIERDAVTIFSSFIAKDAPKPIGVGDMLRADAISKICREDGQVDSGCFASCQEFVLKRIQSQYFPSFRDSAFHSKHQINVLTSTTVYLPDILLAENALCYFLEYMEQEGAGDLMQLWLAVDNFQQQLTLAKEGYDWEQAQNDAMVIYDKYFSLQATNPMGFDDKLRFLIEENICREGGPMPDCFSEAKVIVLKTLDKMYFNNYLQSQVYYRYLSDLVSTVQMAEDMHHKPKGHHRSGSDASSEHSISSYQSTSDVGTSKPRNTLLAVDTRKGKKATASASASAAVAAIDGDFSMTMDMFNPDDLWKRTSPGGMSLGSVDGLGQFVSNFEHDGSDKRKGGGFLKRWKDKEKDQEEVALRIAQMIINDVNSMTQSSESLGNVLEEDEMDDKARVDGR